jgi:hypothetical protein
MTAAEVFPDELQPPVGDVITEFEQMQSRGRKYEAAELAYAIAVRLQAEGRVRMASDYGRTCLALYEELPTSTIEQCTPTHMKVAGVSLPDYLHEDVVRARLGHLL